MCESVYVCMYMYKQDQYCGMQRSWTTHKVPHNAFKSASPKPHPRNPNRTCFPPNVERIRKRAARVRTVAWCSLRRVLKLHRILWTPCEGSFEFQVPLILKAELTVCGFMNSGRRCVMRSARKLDRGGPGVGFCFEM